jgi:hypothetical protein
MCKLPSQPRHILRLLTRQPQSIRLRDSELVLCSRNRNLLYQCRYNLANSTWHRQSTGKALLEQAISAACGLYKWHTDKGVRYLRIWVDGKTDGRCLIAKQMAMDVLQRLHARQRDLCPLSFETTLELRVPHLLFRFSGGHQPHGLLDTFRRLMRNSGRTQEANGDNRTLFSLRHTYATLEISRGDVYTHTISKHMDNSGAMIERHYSKLTATMTAERFASICRCIEQVSCPIKL